MISNEIGRLNRIIAPMFLGSGTRPPALDGRSSIRRMLGASEQDDCAAYLLTGEQALVFCSDYVRGPKFALAELGLLSNYDLGWYLAGANLSDIAAMGALPVGLLSVIRYPKNLDDTDFTAVLEGIRDCCSSVGASNDGGDIGTAERLILSASAFGVVEPANLLRRSGAKPGQVIVSSGFTGLAGAIMKYYLASNELSALADSDAEYLLDRWRRVMPRVNHGRLFARHAGVSSCIDTSDGLAVALGTICQSSGVGMVIDRDLVPIDSRVRDVADALDVDVLELVFGDSVDFELIATVDRDNLHQLREAAALEGLEIHVLGAVVEGDSASIAPSEGGVAPLPGVPWTN